MILMTDDSVEEHYFTRSQWLVCGLTIVMKVGVYAQFCKSVRCTAEI